MDKTNIIEESFFKKLANIFSSAKKSKVKKSKNIEAQMQQGVDDINDSISDLEKGFEKLYGKKFNFAKMTIDDMKKDLRV